MISKRVVQIAVLNSPSYGCNVIKTTCPVRQYASKKDGGGFFNKFVDKVGSLTGSKKSKDIVEPEEEEPYEISSNDAIFADMEEIRKEEEERKREKVEKSRLKSRLFHSDRALLNNEIPSAGIQWEKNDDHRSNKFKASMLARYGKKTGINPSVAW